MQEIVVFTALKAEMSPLKASLSRTDKVTRKMQIHIGQMDGKRVILVLSGVGKRRSLEAAEFVFSNYCPDGVLSAGFCGGLIPKLKPSDVALCSWVISDTAESSPDLGKILLGDRPFVLQRALNEEGIRAKLGGFASVSRPVFSSDEKSTLADRTGAMVAEMETFHLGRFFLDREVPFVGIRAVIDSVEDRIPLGESMAELEGGLGLLKALWRLMSHKDALFQLWRLYRNGRRAQVALGRSVAAVIKVWPWD